MIPTFVTPSPLSSVRVQVFTYHRIEYWYSATMGYFIELLTNRGVRVGWAGGEVGGVGFLSCLFCSKCPGFPTDSTSPLPLILSWLLSCLYIIADVYATERPAVVYQSFDDGYKVRSMTIDDAKIVQKWYTGMGTIAEHDLSICLHVFPQDEPGFYIGEYEGEVVASAIRIPWSESKPKVCVLLFTTSPTLPCTIHSYSIKEWTPLYL